MLCRRFSLFLAAQAALIACPLHECEAAPPRYQQAPAGHVSRRPPLSPYLDLFRQDSGLLPSYHAFVLPQRQLEVQRQQQWQSVDRLQERTRRVEKHQLRATGHGGAFMNYLHFYHSPRVGGR